MICNSGASTMVESDLGTMVINESEEEEDDGTMKRELLPLSRSKFVVAGSCLVFKIHASLEGFACLLGIFFSKIVDIAI